MWGGERKQYLYPGSGSGSASGIPGDTCPFSIMGCAGKKATVWDIGSTVSHQHPYLLFALLAEGKGSLGVTWMGL